MRQFSIKNERAFELLEEVTKISGEGKTEAVTHALERYRDHLLSSDDLDRVLDAIRTKVHSRIPEEQRGRAPSKEEIEELLELP